MNTFKNYIKEKAGIADARFTKILRDNKKDVDSLLAGKKLSSKLYTSLHKYYMDLKEMPNKVRSSDDKAKFAWVTKQIKSDLS